MLIIKNRFWIAASTAVLLTLCVLVVSAEAQKKTGGVSDAEKSIGGDEHQMSVYGVKIGMDVPTALRAVFENAGRKPGEEKPDAMRREGDGKKDIRVLYKNLPKGELQIVFDQGKFVSEIVLTYLTRPNIVDLRLPSSSGIGVATSGERYDDRYTIGFVDNKKQEKLWWRDTKSGNDFGIRLSFLSGNILRDGQLWWQTIAQKAVTIKPGHKKRFRKAMSK
ncbi:MAG: hypothetical protein HKN25_04130 [Pyrinomonadaceae bacterium]|nr:hypothetical protein [Pyrinomonadaceae bacterium]